MKFPLLSDWWAEVGQSYGVWNREQKREHRAVIVLNENRVVEFSRLYGDEDVPDMDEIFRFLKALAERKRAA